MELLSERPIRAPTTSGRNRPRTTWLDTRMGWRAGQPVLGGLPGGEWQIPLPCGHFTRHCSARTDAVHGALRFTVSARRSISLIAAGFWASLPVDFFVKVSRIRLIINQSVIRRFRTPVIPFLVPELILRALRLNCLTAVLRPVLGGAVRPHLAQRLLDPGDPLPPARRGHPHLDHGHPAPPGRGTPPGARRDRRARRGDARDHR